VRRAIAWIVGGLPFDARSRRALDETLLDWEGEATESNSVAERTVTEIRGLLSIARVTSMSVLRESIDFSWLRGLGRRFAVAGAIVLALTVWFAVGTASEFGVGAVEIVPFFAAAVSLAILPIALVLIIAWRPRIRSVPSVGTALVLTVSLFALTQWAMPHWQWRASELTWPYVKADLEAKGVEVNQSYLPKRRPPPFPLESIGSACLAGSGIILAAAFARRRTLQSRLWLVGLPVLYVAVVGSTKLAVGATFLYFRYQYGLGYADPLGSLLVTTTLLLLAAKYGRQPDDIGSTTTPAEP
jgi:hypothetical protein